VARRRGHLGVGPVRKGARFGRWRLRRCLGQGESGTTWLCADADGRQAAVKILQTPPGEELLALARITHPSVVGVHGGGGAPVPHLIMEFASGRPLSAWMGRRPAPEQTAVNLGAHLADALAAVHQVGVIHGDIKPDNVVVDSIRAPRLKLVDFGFAGHRRGGTLNYAAPECLKGAQTSASSDVYSLGMILWEMIHGELPWAELGFSTPLMKRQREAPAPTVGEPWLRTLLTELLAPNPKHRPDAAQLADRLAQHGAVLPAPGTDLLMKRARRLWMADEGLDLELARWLGDGGTLALIGGPGSGKTHALDHLVHELQARGLRWLRLDASAPSWMGVEGLLASRALPGGPETLPAAADGFGRAEAAARALVGRCAMGFHLLVDDLHAVSEPARLFVDALARRGGAHICAATTEHVGWADVTVMLPTLAGDDVRRLVFQLLGDVGDADDLMAYLAEASAGLPGPLVVALLHAVRQEAVVWRGRGWIVDTVRLGEIASQDIEGLGLQVDVGEDARLLGSLIGAERGGLDLDTLAVLTGLGEGRARRGIVELSSVGLARLEAGRVNAISAAAAASMRDLDPSPERTHRLLAEQQLGRPGASAIQLGWHIVGSGDERLGRREGPAVLDAACILDGAEAGQLADALWALAESGALAASRLHALIAAGRVDEAEAFGESLLASLEPSAASASVLGQLAHIQATVRKDDERALELLERAREALDGAPLPEDLVEIKAKVHFRAERAYEAIEAARSIADRPPPEEPERLDRWLSMRVTWAQALQQVDRLADAVSLLEGLDPAVGLDRASRALYDATLGRLLWHAGRTREAGEVMARAAAEERGLPAVDRARMLSNAGLARYGVGDRSGALRAWEQAALLMERMGDEAHLVVVRTNLCVGYREAGQWERAQEAGEWAHEKARELDMPESEAMAAGNLGDLALAMEELTLAGQWFDRADTVATAHALDGEKVELARREAELAAHRNADDAADKAHLAQEKADAAGDVVEKARSAALLALAHARNGHVEDLFRCVDEAVEPLVEAGAAGELAEVRLWAARAMFIANQRVDALQQATRALVYADEVEHAELRKRADGLVDSIRRLQGVDVQTRQEDKLLGLAVAVARERDVDRLLDAVANATLDLLDSDRAFVILDHGGQPDVAASAMRRGVVAGQPSSTVVQRALADGKEVIAADVDERGDLRGARSVMDMELKSAMCVPMFDGEVQVGALYVDSRAASEAEVTRSVDLLRALGSFAAVAVHNARQLRDAAARAEQAAEIAHDLRSPAAGIQLAALELLEECTGESPERDALVRILDGAQRVQGLAGEFLIERSSSRRPLDLTEHVHRALALLRYEAAALDVEIVEELEPGIEVIGDHNGLSRIVGNLVGNAVKYSPEGGEVSVTLSSKSARARLVVRDTGPGIPEEDLPQVFERGVQARGAREGLGLGLAIVQRLVLEHGGTATAMNHPDGGARFVVEIPLA
jgi:signal transduction histidine kinase